MSETRTVGVVHWESGTYRVRPVRGSGGNYRFEIDQFEGDDDGAQDFGEEDDPRSWSTRHAVPYASVPTPADAVEAGLVWLRSQHDGEVTLEWVESSLFLRLVDVARDAGLDSACWSFGQHAGLSWTLMDKVPGEPFHQLGIWQRWQDARFAIEGMIAVLLEVRHQRDTGRLAAKSTRAIPAVNA